MPALSIRSLRKSFPVGSPQSPTSREAIIGVDLDVEDGELLGIVGRGGAGKTTLLLCAAGLLRRDSGTVSWYGEKFPGGGCVPGVAYVPPLPTYYPFLTVRDALEYYCARENISPFRRSLVERTLAGLSLGAKLSTQVAQLGISELKRVGIAQALLDNPQAIMLDGTLDDLGSSESATCRTLRESAARDTTVIATSRHASVLASLATRIVVMDRGRLTGSYSSIPTDHAVFAELPAGLRQIAERLH
jgi:ABC-2 type transport system ATP-binding protein